MNLLDKINELSVSAEESTTFPILYKYTNVPGQVQQWQIFVDGDTFYTEEGVVGGVITRSKPTKCTPKNVGKINATNGVQQAVVEARAKHQKKLDKHYNEVLTDAKSFYEPMLAHKYEDHRDLIFTVPTFISPKLDGLRCINMGNMLQSRGGKTFNAPHLHQDSLILDGELYNHTFKTDFNAIVSLFKKQKLKPEDEAKSKALGEYHIYDLPGVPGVFSTRYAALKEWFSTQTNPMFKMVEAIQIYNEVELEAYHKIFLGEGYEGSMIRLDLADYEGKRTKQLLKYKDWIDDEFEVIGFTEGKGQKSGMVGNVILRLKDGQECNSNMDGTFDYSKYVFEHQEEFIGRLATVKFQNYTPDGKLRCPYVKSFNRESYE